MFSARGVALNVTTASVQLRVLHNSVYLSARLKLQALTVIMSLISLIDSNINTNTNGYICFNKIFGGTRGFNENQSGASCVIFGSTSVT
jgi:hypothetical protein